MFRIMHPNGMFIKRGRCSEFHELSFYSPRFHTSFLLGELRTLRITVCKKTPSHATRIHHQAYLMTIGIEMYGFMVFGFEMPE